MELVFVLGCERPRAVEVFRHAGDVELESGKGVFQAPLDEMYGDMGDIDADPAAVQFLRGMDRGAAAAKWIENKIAFVGRSGDDAFEQGKRFLGGIAKALLGLCLNWLYVGPNIVDRVAFLLVQVALETRNCAGFILNDKPIFEGFVHPLFCPPPNSGYSEKFVRQIWTILYSDL